MRVFIEVTTIEGNKAAVDAENVFMVAESHTADGEKCVRISHREKDWVKTYESYDVVMDKVKMALRGLPEKKNSMNMGENLDID